MALKPFKGILGYNFGLSAYTSEKQEGANFYLYKFEKEGASSVGVVGIFHLSEDNPVQCLLHEYTFDEHVQELLEAFKLDHIQYKPILLMHQNAQAAEEIRRFADMATLSCVSKEIEKNAIHSLWKIANPDAIEPLMAALQKIETCCVADGHHRYQALEKYFVEQSDSGFKPSFLAALFYANDLPTRSKGVVITNPFSYAPAFLERLGEVCEIEPIHLPKSNLGDGEFCMYFQGAWSLLRFKEKELQMIAERGWLSIEAFKLLILNAIFSIPTYVGHPDVKIIFDSNNLLAIPKYMSSYQAVGFLLPNDSAEKVFNLAKSRRVLDPNSTYFENKLLHALISYHLKNVSPYHNEGQIQHDYSLSQ